MSEDHGENGNSSGDVPEIELIIKVRACKQFFILKVSKWKKKIFVFGFVAEEVCSVRSEKRRRMDIKF